MQKKKFSFKLFLCVGGIFFGACSPKATFSRFESLIVAIPNAPFSLDPRVAKDAEGQKISALIYDGLVTLNERSEVVPLLAEKWESAGPLRTRFHLRRNLRFSNGSMLTAKDVACTFEHILDSKNLSPMRADFEKMTLVLIDDFTLEIHLKESFAPFFVLLKKGIVACDGFSGTGPYTLVEHVSQKRVVLKSNADYFGGAPKIPTLIFEVVKDDTTRVLKLMKHEVDLVQNGIPALIVPKIQENPKIKMAMKMGTTFAYLGMNLRDPVLQRKEVRQALAYALDRDQIIHYLWKNFTTKADSLLSPTHWAYAKGLLSYEHNPEKARALLRAVGVEKPALVLKTSTVRERVEIAKLIAHQLNEAGFNVRVQPNDWGIFFRDIKNGNFQLYTSTWVGVVEPDLFYNILHSSQFPPNGDNRSFFANAKADQWTTQARSNMDPAARAPIYRDIQQLILGELPFMPMWYENNIALYWDDLHGVHLSSIPDYRNFAAIERTPLRAKQNNPHE